MFFISMRPAVREWLSVADLQARFHGVVRFSFSMKLVNEKSPQATVLPNEIQIQRKENEFFD